MAEAKEHKEPKPLIELKCKECGETFLAKTRHQKYCSKKCKDAAWYRKKKGHKAKRDSLKPKNFPCGHRDCKYAIKLQGGMCNYFEMTGELRRCATNNCEKYEKVTGKKKAKAKPLHLGTW